MTTPFVAVSQRADRRPQALLVSWVRTHPVAAFLAWFFPIGWGIVFSRALFDASIPIEPFLIASTAVGLLLPTLVITRLVDGSSGVEALLRRMPPPRAAIGWYALAFLGVPVLATALATVFSGPPAVTPSALLEGLLVNSAVTFATTRAQGAVLDIRRLVSALRPPALDELGLVGALRQVARAAEPNPASVRVEVSGPEVPLPAAVEVAAFRIAQEALTNVSRHAHARSCAIRLRCSEAAVELDVEDDGLGVSSEGRAGVGLGSMRERAEELGGTFVLEHRAEGGTRVRAVLPLARGAVSS